MNRAGAVATEVSMEGEGGSAREPGSCRAAPSGRGAASRWIAIAWARTADGDPGPRSTGVETAGCAELIKDIVARVPGARAGSAVSCDNRFGAKRIRNLRLRPARDTGRRHRHLSEQRGRPGMIARTRVFSRMAAVAAVLLAGLATAVAASAAEIRIEVEDVLGDRGTILVALCDSETYLTGSCPYGGTAPAEDGKVVLTIPDVAPGRYAALVFHDENDNREFDTGASGIPAEGYGFSNDALGQFGPPRYEDAEVTIHEGTNVVRILLVY